MLISERQEATTGFDSDVHAIAASLNGTERPEGIAAPFSVALDDAPPAAPVILHRRASQGLQSRLAQEQLLWPVQSEEGCELTKRLERLEHRLEGIASSVEFSEAFLSLKLKPQIQELVQASVSGSVCQPSKSLLRHGLSLFLILFVAASSSALLAAEVHSDSASRLVEWTSSQAETMWGQTMDNWLP